MAVEFCSSTSQCSGDTICQASPISLISVCRTKACDAEPESPAERPVCGVGICEAPVVSSLVPAGITGTSPGDTGQSCGPYRIGQVTKNRGCKSGPCASMEGARSRRSYARIESPEGTSRRRPVTRRRAPASTPEHSAGRAAHARRRCDPDARRKTRGADGASVARRAGPAG